MAKGNVNPPSSTPPPSTNPAPNPTPSPSPTGTGGGNVPTGNSGFSMDDSSMQRLQRKAGDLGSQLANISSGLRGLNFSGNALGPIGVFAVPELNRSNDNAIAQAERGAKAFTEVQSGLRATQQTAIQTDTSQQSTFRTFDTSTNAKPPPGAANTTPGNNTQGGPKVSGPGSINGGGVGTTGINVQGGPKVSQGPTIKGGAGPASGGLNTPGGPSVSTAPNVKGGTGPVPGGLKASGGPAVGTTPNVKGGTGPATGGINTPGGPAVGTTPNVKGGTGPVPGGLNTPGGPTVGTTPNVRGGGGPVAGGPRSGGPSVGATPNVKGGTGPVGSPKGPGGSVAPPVIGGTPGAPGSPKPGNAPGGKGAGIPPVSGGATPGSSSPGPKAGVTPPGPQSAATSLSTGGPRGATPPGMTPGMAPGMAPPMAPGATPGQAGGERGGSKFGTGGGKGVFDAPKPGTPDSTITKAPPNSASTPPPAPKPGAPGSLTPGSSTPGVSGSATPGDGSPKPGIPGASTPGAPSPSTPGTQSTVNAPPQGTGTRGAAPGVTPPAAAAPAAAPPMAPGGANPAAAGSERGGNKFGTPGPSKGVFDTPKPPTPDNTITRAPGTSPSTPPPAPKPTPLSPPPATTPSSPNPNTPPPNPNTAPPNANTPPPNANTPPSAPNPATNVPPSPRPDPTPSPQTPKADTPPPAQPRPAPNVPPVNTPSPAPNVNPPIPNPATNVPPTNTPNTNTPSANPPSPNTNTPPVTVPSPRPDTNVPPVNTPPPNPATNVPPANPNTPPVNAPAPKPDTSVPPPNTSPVQPPPDTNTPRTRPAPPPPTNAPQTNVPPVNTPAPSTTAAPDLIVAAPLITPAPNTSTNPNTSANPSPNPAPTVVPRSHPAAANFQAQTRPDGGKGKKRAAIKKYLGYNFIKGLFSKPKPTPAPSARTPPTPKYNDGPNVINDVAWLHSEAETAPWFEPKDPADRTTWKDRRIDTPGYVRTIDTVDLDITTDSTPRKVAEPITGVIQYDLRRIETSPGKFVQEYTVKVHLEGAEGVSPEVVEQVRNNAAAGVNDLLNRGYRLPGGDQFHLNLEFVDKADAHTTIKVNPAGSDVDQKNWSPAASPAVLAHETLHYLGVPDEYRDSKRVLNQHATNSRVHNDGSLMGTGVHRPDPRFLPRHMWRIEHYSNGRAAVHDTRLEKPGPATMPLPAEHAHRATPDTTPDSTPDSRPETAPDTTPDSDARTRSMPKRDEPDSDTDTDTRPGDEPPAKRKPAPDTWSEPGASTTADDSAMDVDDPDVEMGNAPDSQLDDLANQFESMSISDVKDAKFNDAFKNLGADGRVELPTKNNYLAKLQESVENEKRPSFVVNMIVGHDQLGQINDVVNSITQDAGDVKNDIVFVVGVNGKAGDAAAIEAAINDANAKIAGRTEPIALVQLPTFTGKFPYGDMRNETMTSDANKFAVGALMGKDTHPYISFQDFDTGSRQVPSGKDVFNHFKDSLNPPDVSPIRPLIHSGGYRVADPDALVRDVQTRINSEQAALDANTDLDDSKRKTKQKALDTARQQLSSPDFVQRFEQAIKNDMDARVRQSDTAPLLPYSPEPNLFIDAVVPLVDSSVRFSDKDSEFNGLGKSMNEFAGKELTEIHQNQLPPPQPDPTAADPDADVQATIDSDIAVDAATNRNPYRGQTFSTDFVDGAVGTDLSRIALGFAETKGSSWPQSHANFTTVPNRTYGADKPQDAKAAKFETSAADIRSEFGKKDHSQREAQQKITHEYHVDPDTRVHTPVSQTGGWTPSKVDALKLGWEDPNTLNKAVSAPLPDGRGHIGIDPQLDPRTAKPKPKLKLDSKGKPIPRTEADLGHIDVNTKQQKMAAALNVALSDNNSNVTRTFGMLEHGILPIADNPRNDGLFQAVHDAMAKEPQGKTPKPSAADLRESTVQKGSTASTGITTQIANFRQEHGLDNGHLVNALIEPGPTPQTHIPDSYKGKGGNTPVDNSNTPGRELSPDERAEQNAQDAADKQADNAKAAKAEELAGRLLATDLKRPLRIHHPDGSVQTLDPFTEPGKKQPKLGKPIDLSVEPNPNGKSTYSPYDPGRPGASNQPGPATRRAPDAGPSTRPAPPNPAQDTSTRSAPSPEADTSTRSAPEPEVQTRPAPPTPNPVIPMTTLAPPAVGQVMPAQQNLPDFFQDNKALGSIAPTEVRGAENVTGAIPNLKQADADRIQKALTGDFESFLDDGRNFQVKIGNTWYEANVRATMRATPTPSTVDAPDIKVDATAQSGNSSSTTHTVATANDVGGSATAGVAMGPYGSLGAKAQLATPAQAQNASNSLTDQRSIRSGEGSTQATVPVTYDITLTDANGEVTTFDPVDTGTDVTLQIPNDLATITSSGNTSTAVTPPDADWGAKIEHPAPEAVSVDNRQKAFNDVAQKLHPSIVKVGSPGREALQNFLSPTSIRDNLGSMLGGAYVTSPDLISPHASKGAAVQMTAKLQTAELVGTHNSSVLRLHETSSYSSGVASTTKTGFDVNAGFGGNIGVPNAVGGQVGATAGYSARTAESVNAGTNTSHKSGIQVKGDTGLYKVTAEVEVRTPSGDNVKVPVTTYMRMGLPEAGALGLPTPHGTRNSIADPATAGTKFPPPYLSDAIAAGNAKVGEFAPAAQVQNQVEAALRRLPGFEKFLPNWNDPSANPRSSKGKGFADVAEQLANQRTLTSQLSPAALRTNMDSLMGPGVQVQLKNSGTTTNTYVNVTVKAKLTNSRHLGQADARNVRDASSTGPKLDSSTATTKGWSAGVEGKVTIPAKTNVASLTPAPQFGVKYNHARTDKTAAGPTVNSTSLNVGSPDAQVFRNDVEFEVEITTFTRPRAWVRRIVPGAPGFHVPEQHVVAKTGTAGTDLKPIKGEVNLWVSDSSTLDNDPGDGFTPGDPEVRRLEDAPTIKDLLSGKPEEKSPDFLHVEAIANTTALRDQGIDVINRAAGGDSVLTVPGTASRAQIDKMFSPENIKANLRKLTETGMQEPGLKYDRRVTDRTGAVGMKFELRNPTIVSISDNTATENAITGGYKAGASSSTSQSVDITGGVNVPIKPEPAGSPTQASGAGGVAAAGKVTPWSASKSSSNEVGGSVDRNHVTPSGGRTVLVQLDADVTIVGESRAGNFVHGGTPRTAGSTVTLPKAVFVRVTEDVAREMGLLPDVQPTVPKSDFPKMAPPATVNKDEPSALGLSVVESVPDLSDVVSRLTRDVNAKTAKRFGDPLVPDSVLKDSMSNLQRLVDFSSPASVKAMIDSAMDGGVPLLVHQPGTFGKDSFQVTLRAKADTPRFEEVVNDGVEMEQTVAGSKKVSDSRGRGTGWSAGVKAPGLAAPGSANPNVAGTAGVAAAANIGQSKSNSVTTSTTDQFGYFRGAGGPAARYSVPVEFELVVEKGDQVVATAGSGKQDMVVRLHADNQKVAGAVPPPPYAPQRNTRTAAEGTKDAVEAWQRSGTPSKLPASASVEGMRGAQDLRDATIHALTEAGAGKGLTGKGTGALNSLLSTLSSENLQAHLPGMLSSGPLEVPGLREAALLLGQDADVKVYAKLVDPSLDSLSDSVALENPRSQVSATSGEAKVTESGDVSVGLATGGAGIKQNTDPNDNVSVGLSGVELRHAAEDSSAVSGGPTNNQTDNLKPKTRTGLVQVGVEYRVVATIGGKTAVVDLSAPSSAAVRMPATDAQEVLGHAFSAELTDAQTEVKKAADDWRKAEVEVDAKRHEAQQVINEAAAKLAKNDSGLTRVQIDYNTAIERHLDEQAKLPPLEAQAETARREAARALDTVADLTPRVSGLSVVAMSAQFEVDDAKADADAKARTLQSLESQLARTPDAAGLRGQVDAARQAHADAETALRAAEAEADAAKTALHEAQRQLTDAEAELKAQRDKAAALRADLAAQEQAAAQADAARTLEETRYEQTVADLAADRAAQENRIKEAETALNDARRAADEKQLAWWNAKTVVDKKIADYNNPPVTTSSNGDGGPGTSNALPPAPERSSSAAGPSTDRSVPAQSPRTRPAPPLPNTPAPASTSTADTADTADTATPQAPAGVPSVVIESHLKALTADAMLNASPLAKQMETALTQNADGTHVQSQADVDLLRAAVVLDTRADGIAALIQRHGGEAVARAFDKEFGRPVIETAQLRQFADINSPAGREAFTSWARQVAADIFNHDKGYHRGTDFAHDSRPKRERPEAVDSADNPAKRRRDDDHLFDAGPEPSEMDVDEEVRLVNENGVHNAAFANLAGGRTLTPITAANYLDRTRESIANNEPPAFVVSMIVRASELNQLDSVINGVMANTTNMNGRVAFVLGVNASKQEDIDTALAAAAPTVNNHAVPIALVSVPHGPKSFKFGETRNSTLHSNAHEFAVTALAANGTHPYVSIMDFDAGDRRTREGAHVFDHVTQLMDAEEVGPADGPDVPAPLRPLLVGGGYRVAISPEQLKQDVLDRITGDSKTTDAQKAALTEKLNEDGFVENFTRLIDADMHARRNQQGIHPLLPYTPEPNLFFDALVPLADPSVRFGEGAAEFGQLGRSLNRFNADELAALHTPDDPADLEDATERARVDAENNRHPVRGQAFITDFVSGDTGTDLSRIAYGLIKDGKLPQSHTALPNVSERFFDGKSSKAGTRFADERKRLATGAYEAVEPFRPPAEGQSTTTWNRPPKVDTQLGATDNNRLNPAVSAPMPAPFNQMAAGIQPNHKVFAAHGLVASDHFNNTLRQLRYLHEDVLRQPSPPQTTPDGLYAAIGHVTGTKPAVLRRQVVSLAASDPKVARAVADFTVTRPMHHGHLYGALVEDLNWSMRPDNPDENRGAGNARDLVGHLIATQLGVNVRIHQPGGNPVVLAPMGGQAQVTVELEMAVVNGRVTYRPRR